MTYWLLLMTFFDTWISLNPVKTIMIVKSIVQEDPQSLVELRDFAKSDPTNIAMMHWIEAREKGIKKDQWNNNSKITITY